MSKSRSLRVAFMVTLLALTVPLSLFAKGNKEPGQSTIVPATETAAQPTAAKSYVPIYISNTGSATVSVLDLGSQSITATIDLTQVIPGSPVQSHFIVVTQDGKYIWVGERQGTDDGQIVLVEAATGQTLKTFNVGAAIGMTLSHDGKWLFTVSTKKGKVGDTDFTNVINIFDVANQTWLGKIDHGYGPHVIETTLDSKILWASTEVGGKIVSYDITGLPGRLPTAPTKEIDIYGQLKSAGILASSESSLNLHALAVHPNGKYVIVGAAGVTTGGGDIVVDVEQGKIVARVPGRPHNYEISPNNQYLLSGESNNPDCEEAQYLVDHQHTGLTGPIVRLVDISTLSSASPNFSSIQVVKTIDAGSYGTGGVSHHAYDPTGEFVVVTTNGKNSGDNGRALIVKADTLALVKNLEVGKAPHGVVTAVYGR